MSKLTRVKLKDNIIDKQEGLGGRVRRLEARPSPVTSPLDYFHHVETADLYWDEYVTVRGILFPIARQVEAQEEVE